MPRMLGDSQNIMFDLVDACSRAIGRDAAVKGARNICRYFGGGMYYIPARKITGRVFNEICKVLHETMGEHNANIIIGKAMSLFGGYQIYIPMERYAFADEIALEIYKRSSEENVSVTEMFRDYGISFNHAYKLWAKGRRIKLNKEVRK